MKKRCNGDAVGKAVKNRQPKKFRYDCENFAGIAKISLGLRNFRSHSENFTILAKLGNFARLAKFRYVAKITMPSEILHFCYLSKFSLG